MVFPNNVNLKDFIMPEEESKSLEKKHWYKNNYLLAGVLFFGVVGGMVKYNLGEESAKQNPLESYFCVENIKPRWEENLKTYANQIVWENPDKKFIENDVFDFLVKFNGKIDGRIGMGEDIIVPVYSIQVCRRLGLPEN